MWSIREYGSVEDGDTDIIAFWSLIFILLAYGLFIQIPKKWVVRAVDKYNFLVFILISTVYALTAFTLLIGWLFLIGNTFLGVFLDAATVGMIFGITFWISRRIMATPTS